MHSINAYDAIWEQELGLYGGRHMEPELSYGAMAGGFCLGPDPPIQLDPIQRLPDNPNPPFIIKINLETGVMATELLVD